MAEYMMVLSQPNMTISFKDFSCKAFNMANSNTADFFYYSMRCQEEDNYGAISIRFPDLVDYVGKTVKGRIESLE